MVCRRWTLWVGVLVAAGVSAGCGGPQPVTKPPKKPVVVAPDMSAYAAYVAQRIDILPLTEFSSGAGGAGRATRIEVFVSLLDSAGSQVKAPGVLRFELFEYVQRSADPEGKRLAIWSDIDLVGIVENGKYWRDHLRAYEFHLDFEPQANTSYVLQATLLCPAGKRLSAQYTLKQGM